MPEWWIASHVALWVLLVFVVLLLIGLYRHVGELSLSPARRLAMTQGLDVGAVPPPFQLPDQNGRGLAFPNGGPERTVLIFTDPDCPPCNSLSAEMNVFKRESTRVLMVSGDDAIENALFAQEHSLNFPVLTQEAGLTTSSLYKVSTTPFVFVIGDGRVLAKGITSTRGGVESLVDSTLKRTRTTRKVADKVA